jgi:aryl-alcohol dehydrogenase-like predicted oxidoreductase
VLHKRGVTAPIIGATRPLHLDDAAAATEVELDDEEIRFLEDVPATVGGARL